jgi:hypothetical protein
MVKTLHALSQLNQRFVARIRLICPAGPMTRHDVDGSRSNHKLACEQSVTTAVRMPGRRAIFGCTRPVVRLINSSHAYDCLMQIFVEPSSWRAFDNHSVQFTTRASTDRKALQLLIMRKCDSSQCLVCMAIDPQKAVCAETSHRHGKVRGRPRVASVEFVSSVNSQACLSSGIPKMF